MAPNSPLRAISPAARRDLIAAVTQHAGRLYSGPDGAGEGLRVRWNIALALEEAAMARMAKCDPRLRLWQWEATEAGAAAAREAAGVPLLDPEQRGAA